MSSARGARCTHRVVSAIQVSLWLEVAWVRDDAAPGRTPLALGSYSGHKCVVIARTKTTGWTRNANESQDLNADSYHKYK